MKVFIILIAIVVVINEINAGKFLLMLFRDQNFKSNNEIYLATIGSRRDIDNNELYRKNNTAHGAPKDVKQALEEEDDDGDSDYPFPDDSDAEFKKRCQDKLSKFLTLC